MKPLIFKLLCLAFLAISCQQPETRPLTLSKLFTDHMVIQQDTEVAIWGAYTPNQRIEAEGSWGEKASTTADTDGKWKILLKSPKAGGPFTLNINTPDSSVVINDVMSGEVWLASGQSNMEMPLKGWPPNDLIENSSTEIANANLPELRMFTVTKTISLSPQDSLKGDWQVCSPETAGDFSATAYFFAKRLQSELQVPVGIIHSSWGGTVAEAWTSEPTLRKLGDFNETLDQISDPDVFGSVNNWYGKFKALEIPADEEGWGQIEFDDAEGSKDEFDDSNWTTIEIPGNIDQIEQGYIDGAVWIRKQFDIEDPSSDYILKIGAIDDMDATFINGKKVGGLVGPGHWNSPREMPVPKELLKKGKNTIAIRIIDTGGGGSVSGPVELSNENGDVISLKGTWKKKIVAEIYLDKFYVYGLNTKLEERPDFMQINPNLPSVLFNGMIEPLIGYRIKGAIWYQGESNVGRDEQYQKLFPAMIKDWREQWQYDFPFYYVQIAPFIYESDPDKQVSQKLREAQRLSLKTPNTGMVVTLDIGNPANIHPGNKHDVGARLAGLALDNDYGKDLVSSGPLFREAITENNKLILSFDATGSGLMAGSSGLTGFEIAGDDKVFKEARASIEGDKVVLSAPGISSPKYARYAWYDDSSASLFNKEGLPASSFSTAY